MRKGGGRGLLIVRKILKGQFSGAVERQLLVHCDVVVFLKAPAVTDQCAVTCHQTPNIGSVLVLRVTIVVRSDRSLSPLTQTLEPLELSTHSLSLSPRLKVQSIPLVSQSTVARGLWSPQMDRANQKTHVFRFREYPLKMCLGDLSRKLF